VPSPLIRRPYIRPGCVEAAHMRMASTGAAPFFNTVSFLLVPVSVNLLQGGESTRARASLSLKGRPDVCGGA
jgi:hypothetical protein